MSSRPATSAILRPVRVEPVKWIIDTPGWATSASPTSTPPGTTWSSPAGSPASAKISASTMPPLIGVSGDGFSTTALPSASAGATTRMPRMSGKFHGVIAPTTPRGIRSAMLYRPGSCDGMMCEIARDVSPAASNSSFAAPPTS